MRTSILLVAIVVGFAAPASAQRQKPLPRAAIDFRGFYTGLGQDPVTATSLGLAATDLPNRGLGGVVGVQIYIIRKQNIAIGIGGEGLLARGHAQATDDTGTPTGDPVHQQLRGFSGGFSLNFGHRNGWSYLSAGMGPLSLSTYVGDTAPDEPPPTQMTINLGAGAKWFSSRHVAFCFDLRFYQTQPEVETPSYPPRQRSQLMIMSAGIALR